MAPVATSRAAQEGRRRQGRQRRELDGIGTPVSGPTFVRRARPEEVGPLLCLAHSVIGGSLAGEATVRRVMALQSDSVWAFLQASKLRGGMALLILNSTGEKALLAGALDTRDPAQAMLARAAQPASAIYVWAVAHRSAGDGIVKIFAKLKVPRYVSANVYAVPATEAGRRWMQGWGFAPIRGDPRNLHRYVRWANRGQQPGS
jgi:hypothetical protein